METIWMLMTFAALLRYLAVAKDRPEKFRPILCYYLSSVGKLQMLLTLK